MSTTLLRHPPLCALLHIITLLLLVLSFTFTYAHPVSSSTPTLNTQIHHLPSDLYSSTHLHLSNSNHTYTADVTSPDGLSQFTNLLPDNTYTLHTHSVTHVFPIFTVTLHRHNNSITAQYASGGHYGQYVDLTIEDDDTEPTLHIYPYAPAQYYFEREPFNYAAYLKNPMVIMMGITFVMIVVMPRMLNNMDPEELKQMRETQQQFSLQGLVQQATGQQQQQQQQPRIARR